MLDLVDMQELQRKLQAKYCEQWELVDPIHGRNKLLWMLAEAGEAAQIIKHEGDQAIMTDMKVRHDFVEELCDVLMYLNDVCLCYNVTPDERNMNRW